MCALMCYGLQQISSADGEAARDCARPEGGSMDVAYDCEALSHHAATSAAVRKT